MKKPNVIITGSNGMLGKDIVSLFSNKERFNLHGINRSKKDNKKVYQHACDLTDFNKAISILNELNPDIIIYCAANVNVDACEKDKEYALKLNAYAAQALASYKPVKTKFVYISTDSIFDGIKGNYTEEEIENPLNYYAYSKLQGEKLVLKENPNTIVIRTNIYGFHIPEGNSLVEWALNNLKYNNKILGFKDVYFNPVYTKQLAKVIFNLIGIDFNGMVNVGCEKGLNKYEFLIKLARKFNLDSSLISESSVDGISFKAKRPKNTILNLTKLKNIINYEIEIDDGINEMYNDYIEQAFIKGGLKCE
ncbi:dTDP-4-dehydrorhamnose reductase family protein [Clostridium magnum]|uniref:dTDP-4-dehydrorhamnose reductase n=1 Tax=Clostridium magnum DSM 2767 TaxID=1121326 RepID=A0A162UMZ7_9CLOT|nr:SDR family oxidoreductase [Clostridium magnum]KZL94095.1 dTDP-4-dehydrorhamnose reductase [Clostridium magnum DSM 2767]SHH95102.1 dTDP-4-dehydrorhamnose reductase [Clostridium magnum DSM 2767]